MTLSKLFYNKKFYFTVDDWLLPTLIIFLEYLKFESGEYQHNFLLLKIKELTNLLDSWILHAIRLYLAVPTDTDEDCNHEPLESRSPSEIRRLLLRVLHLKNWTADDNQFGLQYVF